MVELVLKSAGVKSFALVGKGFTIEVGGGNGRLTIPFDFCEYTRDRQTPFFIFHKRTFGFDGRVDIDTDIFPLAVERNDKGA